MQLVLSLFSLKLMFIHYLSQKPIQVRKTEIHEVRKIFQIIESAVRLYSKAVKIFQSNPEVKTN